MLTFGAPHMSLLLLLVPVAAALFWSGARLRRVRLARWADAAVVERLVIGAQPWRRVVRIGLLLAGLAGFALALTRPRWGFHSEEVTRRGIDLVLVVDVSESMRAEDVSPSRLERAKREIADFLDLVEGDRIALVAAAGTSFVQCPLTLDYEAVRMFLSLVDTDLIPTPGTDLGAALLTAAEALEPSGPSRGKAIVLISDGGNLEGDPAAVAAQLQEQGITIYAVGIGNPDQAVPIRAADGSLKEYEGTVVTTRLEEGTLTAIATAGDGVYVRAVTGDLDLEKIYADIRDRHQAVELGRSRRKVYHERFGWPLGFGLLCLIAEACVADRGHGRRAAAAASFFLLFAPPASADVSGDVARGLAAYEREDYTAAQEAFARAHEAAPADPRTAYALGAAEYQAGDYETAVGRFETAAATSDPVFRARCLYNAGNAYAQLGQLDKAAEAYERSLRLDPADTDAKANLELVRRLIQKREQEKEERESEQQDEQNQEGKDGEESKNDTPSEPDDAAPDGGENDSEAPASQPSQPPASQPAQPPEPQPDEAGDGQQENAPGEQTPPEQNAAGAESGSDAQEDGSAAAGNPAGMTRAEADQWLQHLPDEETDALKDFWRRQQPQPAGRPRRDW